MQSAAAHYGGITLVHQEACEGFLTNLTAYKIMNDIKELEKNIEKCLEKIEQFAAENNALRTRMEELTQEKARLMQKNDQAKTRLESMISRLRNLEQAV